MLFRSFASYRGHALTSEDRLRRDVILDLMCHGAIDKRAIEARHASRVAGQAEQRAEHRAGSALAFDEHFVSELAELVPLAADGLVELGRDELRVTPLGQLFLRNVALPFDRYFRERTARGGDGKPSFSRTV